MTKAMIGVILAAASLTLVSVGPAAARQTFIDGAASASPADYPGAPKPVRDTTDTPYAMNYSDEAAQTIGVHDGQWDVFSAKPAESRSYLPSLSGGLGGDGAMLKLQWHPGE